MRHSRRDFIRLCTAAAAGISLTQGLSPLVHDIFAAVLDGTRPPVLWLQGQACTGCTVTLLNSVQPSVADLLLKIISLDYQPTVMAAEGEQAWEFLLETAKANQGRYVLAVEGSIPVNWEGRTCVIAEHGGHHVTMLEAVKQLAPGAAVTLALGTCAAYGGIPAARGSQTGAMGVNGLLGRYGIHAPVINVPGCPPHPDWIVGSLLLALQAIDAGMLESFLKLRLDSVGRIIWFYPNLHINCPHLPDFERGHYCKTLTDKQGCRFALGCKGPRTGCTSWKTGWNGHVNWCIANATCVGCTSPEFPDGTSPFYENPEVIW